MSGEYTTLKPNLKEKERNGGLRGFWGAWREGIYNYPAVFST